jgi:epoxyqueuosine reductase
MGYLENHFEKRLDPTLLVPGTKSVISLLYNYYPEEKITNGSYHIARYAYGKDYHYVIKYKLKQLYYEFQERYGEMEGRVFVDSAPVMERAWAEKAGLGWTGKNTLLLNKRKGSYFFLAEIMLPIDFEYDQPFKTDHCGSCTRCIDACPTEAILDGKILDAQRCISYLTIELKGEIPNEFKGKMADWIFGCDICQEVCPWNRHSIVHQEEEFLPNEALRSMSKKDWKELDELRFKTLFKHSPIKRTKFTGLKRNIDFVGQ